MSRRGTHPNSLAALRRAAIRPGETRNPFGINRHRVWSQKLYEQGQQLLKATPAGEKLRVKFGLAEDATWYDAAALAIFAQAIQGNVAAFDSIVDRVEGSAPRRLELSGPEGGDIPVTSTADLLMALKHIYGISPLAPPRKVRGEK